MLLNTALKTSNRIIFKQLSKSSSTPNHFYYYRIGSTTKYTHRFKRINRGYFWNPWASKTPNTPNNNNEGGSSTAPPPMTKPQKANFVAGIDEDENTKNNKLQNLKDRVRKKRIELQQKVSEGELGIRAKKFSLKFFMRNSRMVFYIMYKHWVEDYIEYIMLFLLYVIL